MKSFFSINLKKILKWLAQRTVAKYRPGIIGITGTVGKTSAKEAIYAVLRNFRRVRASSRSFNDEYGLPLTILGSWSDEELKLVSREFGAGENFFKKIIFWLKVVIVSYSQLIFGRKGDYPDLLILEYGAGKPGDLDYLLEIARPQISVVTVIGEIPVHVEYYSGPEAVAREKKKLITALSASGFAVLNFDDQVVLDMKNNCQAPIFTFGFGEGAQVRIKDFENRSDQGRPAGIGFKLEYEEQSALIRINGAFGKTQSYAAAAAATVGLIYGLNLNRIAETLAYYETPPHRMKFLIGIKDTYIIDDSYNASPLSMHAAIETIKEFPAQRKVAILGDMLELGEYTIEAHEAMGWLAAKVFDILITVGERAKFIAEAARKRGLADQKIFSFTDVNEARGEVLGLLKQGDLVLVKASRKIGLDKLVENLIYPNVYS